MDFIITFLTSFFMKVMLVLGVSAYVFLKALTVVISSFTGIMIH